MGIEHDPVVSLAKAEANQARVGNRGTQWERVLHASDSKLRSRSRNRVEDGQRDDKMDVSEVMEDVEEDTSTIVSLAFVRLQSKSRLLPSACCPDKDLVLIVSRVGTSDKMSLWKMQGSKRWEVEVSRGDTNEEQQITAVAWSPDGADTHRITMSNFLP